MGTKIISFCLLSILPATFCSGQDNWDTLLMDGFDKGSLANWVVGPEWAINQTGDNYYLTGKNHSWANCNQGNLWIDYN